MITRGVAMGLVALALAACGRGGGAAKSEPAFVELVSTHDAEEGGSLVLTLDVDVRTGGEAVFEGRLVSVDSQDEVAVARVPVTLVRGRQVVKLVFDGKLLRERGIDGPYLVMELHAQLGKASWSAPRPVRTKMYRASLLGGGS